MESNQKLIDSSAALYLQLKRHFSESEVELLTEAYYFAKANSSEAEPDIQRAPDVVSFNRKPARVAQIVLSLGKAIDARLIAACFFSCCNPLPTTASKQFLEEIILAKSAQDFLNEPKAETPPSWQTELIALAFLLDECRHIHLRTALTQQSLLALKEMRKILGNAQDFDQTQKIRTFLLAHIEKMERICS